MENRNLAYAKLDEGLGGCYERIAYSNVIERIARQEKVVSMLELNATFIAGIPGFNSYILADRAFDITITIHPRDYEDAVDAWELAGLSDQVRIIEWDDGTHTPFDDEQFDLVWNHLAFEHYEEPFPLVQEMSRISSNVVINLTLSPFNIGFLLHWLIHRIQGKKWDHGYFRNLLISTMERIHKKAGLEHIESGGCDDPPWMDTVDAKMGQSMTYLDVSPAFVRSRWVWSSADPQSRERLLIKMLWDWESSMPDWFRRLTAHHLYVASKKVGR